MDTKPLPEVIIKDGEFCHWPKNFKYEQCSACSGHALVPDYGPCGNDFYGPKSCPYCKGTGRVRARNKRVRFI
jgi:DnaJ-class molecular chaperone